MANILQLAAQGKADKVLLDQRVRSILSPYYFSKVILGKRKMVDHLHQNELEDFCDRWIRGETEQAVEWPRAFFKTTTFTQGIGLWVILPVTEADTEYALNDLSIPEDYWLERISLHDQDATQLFAFETQDNAEKKVGDIRWHLEENTTLRWLFPEICYEGSERPWNNRCLVIRRVGERRGVQEGTFEAIGVGGALQSRHYKIIWCDDLVGERAKNGGPEMERTIGWYQRLEGAFENATRKIRWLVSNRWGYNDLNSWVRENQKDVHFHTRAAWEMKNGVETPIFPEQYPMEELLKIQNKMTKYDFSCQYLNSPIMPGEKEVALEDVHFYEVDEDANMRCSCGYICRASSLYRYMHYDPYNAKGPSSTSCPAIVVVGTSADKHHFILDYYLSKENYGKIYDRIFYYNDTWKPRLFTYEDVGHQNLTKHHIETIARTTEYKSQHRNFPRIEGVKAGTRSKERRIREGLFPVIEKKKFSCRRKHQMLLKMLETFPHAVFDHDYDLLDAISQGANLWRFPESEDSMIDARAQDDEYLKHFNEPFSYAGRL